MEFSLTYSNMKKYYIIPFIAVGLVALIGAISFADMDLKSIPTYGGNSKVKRILRNWETNLQSQVVTQDGGNPFTGDVTVAGTVNAEAFLPDAETILETDTLTIDQGTVFVVNSTAAAVALTLPDASDVLGATYRILFVTDGGDLTIVRAGSDTFNATGNTLLTGADAEDMLVMTAVSADRWLIEVNVGFSGSTP